MTRTIRAAVFSGLLVAAGAASAQQIIFFELSDFNGRRFGVNESVANMSSGGFNDRASSVVVRSGNWQLCTDAYFRGRCVTLNPGEYRNLGQIGLANQISSARQLGGPPGGGGGWVGGGQDASVTLYEGSNFGGRSVGVNVDIPNLGGTDFNDRARSMFVQGGTWELCRDDGYRGGCQTFGPGRHPDLGFLSGGVSSIRQVGGGPGGGGGGWAGDWPNSWGAQGRVILYEQRNFGGRRVVVTNEFIPNFSGLGFNDRASSLRIERGYWMFCSDAGFQGTCRTFGPGDHPSLPGGLNNSISSGRRISEDYPYQGSPSWNGYTQQ